ncbi:MAG: type IX secretion system sortase PorU [Candidatus Marinimicrobia bacterium]|nr:type IX secretion system sortase PorU [Candidatus Neomarinimicrobiota bacterium]
MKYKKFSLNRYKFLLLTFLLFGYSSIFGIEYDLIEETNEEIYFRIKNESSLKWKSSENYPNSESVFYINDARFAKISDNLIIPYWQWTIALPTPNKPNVKISNLVIEKITLEKSLTDKDYLILKEKKIIQFTNTGFLGDISAGILELYSIKAGEKPNEIILLKSADIHIQFIKEFPGQKSNKLKEKQEAFYKMSFLNGKSAIRWVHPRIKHLEKPIKYPSGQWIKITVKEDGIYALTYDVLQSLGISENNIDINRIYLYSNSTCGRELSSQIGIEVPDNLVENSRKIIGSENGYFSSGDSIIFWGGSTSGVDADSNGSLKFNRNCYSFENYYWLLISNYTSKIPKSTNMLPNISSTPDSIITDYENVDRHEIEADNFLHSGKRWYGEKFSKSGSTVSILFQLPTYKSEYPASIKIRTKGATISRTETIKHYFKLYLKNSTHNWSSNNYNSKLETFSQTLTSGLNIFRIDYTSSLSSAQAYLDYIECNYQKELKPANKSMDFWGPNSSGMMEYRLSDIEYNNPIVFDITDWSNVNIQSTESFGSDGLKFLANNNVTSRSHYYITSPNKYKSPVNIQLINSPSWNSLRTTEQDAKYVIITNEEFKEAAENIAKLHSTDVPEKDRLPSVVVLQDQILREFNADIPDPHAIRFFLKYAFENWNEAPQYVLLFGDGTYDYRGIDSDEGNYILTYQVSPESESGGGFSSYATDARFVYIRGSDKLMDMAIGRITVRTAEESQNAAEKIRKYVTEPIYGSWRNRITLVADDPVRPNNNEPEHINDSELSIASNIPKFFTLNKLYLLEYPEVQDASTYGVRKPAATEAILKQLERGTTIVNYLGHGSSTVWAQEHVLKMDRDLGKINTGMKLPFWIAGTCSWGQFDNISGPCMPEAIVIEPEDGGIAAFSATRATTAGPNAAFIKSIFQKWFSKDRINRIRIGTLIQFTLTGNSSNNEKYVLFGDPTLYLALPYQKAEFNNLSTDSLKSLSRVSIRGQTEIATGEGIIKVYDSDRYVTRNYIDKNKKSHSQSYILPGDILFKGSIQIDNENFSTKFFVPKDLNYESRYGMINLYAWNEESGVEVSGFYDSLIFAGSESILDTVGPEIIIGFQNINFQDGDIITPDATLEIKIQDSHGINITDQLGHNIILQFDSDESQTMQLTEEFYYDTNSDTSGVVVIPLPDIDPGEHSIYVKAWDNANNSSSVNSTFILTSSTKLELEKVVNYPNPFTDETDITFFLTQPGKVKISIFTIRGLLIREIEQSEPLDLGFNFIHWDGKDDFGDDISRGIYLYRIKAKSIDSNHTVTFIGKMVKSG